MLKVGILGAGSIARTMAKTLRGMQARAGSAALYAIASRDGERARAFAAAEGARRAYGSYEALLGDEQVDLVYIATPHSHHAEQIELCVAHGKPVLCEKAFTGNARQAERALNLARERGVFVTEAIWTRYMPARRMIDDLIASGAIGRPRFLTANLGYAMEDKPRIRLPELAGGALLDLGVYTLNFAAMVFGTDVARMESSAAMLETGVDHTESVSLYYRDGRVAQLTSTALVDTDRHCVVYGDEGFLTVDNVNNPAVIAVYDRSRSGVPVRTLPVPKQITGYEYEVEACARALAAGEKECPEMPHAETLRIMRQMDALRRAWGMRYPFDEETDEGEK